MIAAGYVFEAAAAGFLVNWWAGGPNPFGGPINIAKFVAIAVFEAAVSAGVGSSVSLGLPASSRIEDVDWDKFAFLWFPWWLGDLGAMLMITPALVLWVTDRLRSWDFGGFLEATAIFATAGGVGAIAFTPLTPTMASAASFALLAVLPLTWAALRRGPRETATALLRFHPPATEQSIGSFCRRWSRFKHWNLQQTLEAQRLRIAHTEQLRGCMDEL